MQGSTLHNRRCAALNHHDERIYAKSEPNKNPGFLDQVPDNERSGSACQAFKLTGLRLAAVGVQG